MEYMDRIILGNSLEVLKEMPEDSLQTCGTSPPYYNQRLYEGDPVIFDAQPDCEHEWTKAPTFSTKTGKQGSTEFTKNPSLVESMKKPEPGMFCIHCNAFNGFLGLEPTPELYVKHLVDIFREVRRVLRKDGTLWLNVGDSYASSPGGYWPSGDEFDNEYRKIHRGARRERQIPGLKPKDLIGIPWMLALALRDDGWWLRSTIIWRKMNCMPSSASDRPTTDFEYIFLLAKNGARPCFWTHRDGYGSRTKPEPDYRWKDMLVGDEVDAEPEGDWRTEIFADVGSPTARKEEGDPGDEATARRRWKRFNLWKGHAYYYNGDAINEPIAVKWQISHYKYMNGNIDNYKNGRRGSPGIHGSINQAGRNKRTVWEDELHLASCHEQFEDFLLEKMGPEWMDGMLEEYCERIGDASTSFLDMNTRGFPGAHFAVFPEKLVEPMILAGSSDTVCPNCGAAWLPRKEKTGEFQRRGTGNQEGSPYAEQSSMQAIYEEKGLQPTCGCENNDGSGASVVLDPFSGAGTTCVVAKRKHRHWTGIDTSQEYMHMSERRVANAEPEEDPDSCQLKLDLTGER